MVIRWTPLTSGAAWENGVDFPSLDIPGGATQAVLPMLTGTYLIKAQDSSGNWSSPAMWRLTTGNLLILLNSTTLTEHPSFSGAKNSTVVIDNTLYLDSISLVDSITDLIDTWPMVDYLGGSSPSGAYDASTVLDFGSVATRRFSTHIQALAIDTGAFIDSEGLVDDWPSVDGGIINDATVGHLASISDDGVTYGPWFPMMAADMTCRYAKFRLQFAAATPTHNIGVSEYSIKAEW